MRLLRPGIDEDTLARVRTAVGGLTEPTLRHTLADLGMVGDVTAERDRARVVVRTASSAMPGQDELRADVRDAAMSVGTVPAVEVELEPMSEADRMQVARVLKAARSDERRVGAGCGAS